MPLDLGNLEGVDAQARLALQRAQRYINQLEAALEKIRKAEASPLTARQLVQIQHALQATGSNPLNLTGLTGTPTTTP